MALEEQIETYKNLAPWKRSCVMVMIGAVLPIFLFYDEGAKIEQELTAVMEKETTARAAFNDSQGKKEKIAPLSENLATTKDKLEQATRLLPDDFLMDEILQATAEAAHDLGLDLEEFAPKEVKSFPVVKYEEMPINLKMHGNFNKVAVFFDRLVHLDKLVHLRNLKIESRDIDLLNIDNWSRLTPQQKSRKASDRSTVAVTAEMIVFRGLK